MRLETDIPMRWPSGPLEIARRESRGPLPAEVRETLSAWHQPAALEHLHGTAVNCLLLSWAAGLPQDEEQQSSLKPLIERGRQAGIKFIGYVDSMADVAAAVERAQAAGLSAVVSENDFQGRSEFPIIPSSSRGKTRWTHPSPLLILNDATWPQIRSNVEEGKDQTSAGPTGIPWVNSNGWYIRLARALSPDKMIWLTFDPSDKNSHQAESYVLAIADARAYGAHWVISLDETLRAGMTTGHSPANEAWRKIAAAAGFFKSHSNWTAYEPQGVFAVLSDFSGPNEFMSGEILNLLCRRHLPFRVIAKSRVMGSHFEGLKAVLYADQNAPAPELRQELLAFVEKGGLLIAPSTWTIGEGTRSTENPQSDYEMSLLGKGRVAVAKQEWQDPYEVATDAHLMLSHANDLIRLWNAGGTNSLYTAASDGHNSLVQIIDYSLGREIDSISLWLKDPYRAARFWSLGAKESASLPKVTEFGEAELHLPPFPLYAAIELEK